MAVSSFHFYDASLVTWKIAFWTKLAPQVLMRSRSQPLIKLCSAFLYLIKAPRWMVTLTRIWQFLLSCKGKAVKRRPPHSVTGLGDFPHFVQLLEKSWLHLISTTGHTDTAAKPWSSLVELDEQPDRPEEPNMFGMLLCKYWIIWFGESKKTTTYRLGW